MLENVLSQGSFLMVNKTLIRKLGLNSAIIIGELYSEYVYWKDKGKLDDGFFYSTRDNIENNTGLTARQQRPIMKNLEDLGILESKRVGIPARNYYRFNEDILLKCLQSDGSIPCEKPQMLQNVTSAQMLQNVTIDVTACNHRSNKQLQHYTTRCYSNNNNIKNNNKNNKNNKKCDFEGEPQNAQDVPNFSFFNSAIDNSAIDNDNISDIGILAKNTKKEDINRAAVKICKNVKISKKQQNMEKMIENKMVEYDINDEKVQDKVIEFYRTLLEHKKMITRQKVDADLSNLAKVDNDKQLKSIQLTLDKGWQSINPEWLDNVSQANVKTTYHLKVTDEQKRVTKLTPDRYLSHIKQQFENDDIEKF